MPCLTPLARRAERLSYGERRQCKAVADVLGSKCATGCDCALPASDGVQALFSRLWRLRLGGECDLQRVLRDLRLIWHDLQRV